MLYFCTRKRTDDATTYDCNPKQPTNELSTASSNRLQITAQVFRGITALTSHFNVIITLVINTSFLHRNSMGRILFIVFIMAIVAFKLCSDRSSTDTSDTAPITPTAATTHNAITTGSTPYISTHTGENNNAKIKICTTPTSKCDAVVIVKRGNDIVRNTYIAAGDTAAIYVPNGVCHVYYYCGNDWDAEKPMPGNRKGGFVHAETFGAEAPVSLNYDTRTFIITPSASGCDAALRASLRDIF